MVKAALLLLLSATLATPAQAATTPAGTNSPDWWIVYGKDGQGRAQLVDLATLQEQGQSREVSLLAVDAAGKEARQTFKVNCAGGDKPDGSVPAFVCGTETYRESAGLNGRDFPPAALAQIYLRELARR